MTSAPAPEPVVLVLPGWNGSGPAHWQSRWQALHGYTRVEQHDWRRPLRGDWTARLEDVVSDHGDHGAAPLLFAAHSLGCLLVAWWAAHSRHAARIAGALLVAPSDMARADVRENIPGWASGPRAPLPFPSILVASRDDPFCAFESARQLAADWGSALHDAGARGHLNADSGLGDWPEGHRLLLSLTEAVSLA